MADKNGQKLELRQSMRGELQNRLIMTPKVRRYISEEENQKRLFVPQKKSRVKK